MSDTGKRNGNSEATKQGRYELTGEPFPAICSGRSRRFWCAGDRSAARRTPSLSPRRSRPVMSSFLPSRPSLLVSMWYSIGVGDLLLEVVEGKRRRREVATFLLPMLSASNFKLTSNPLFNWSLFIHPTLRIVVYLFTPLQDCFLFISHPPTSNVVIFDHTF